MPSNILMPSLAAGMTEGILSRWLKAEGDRVAKGDPIAEIETDKATMEMEAEADGILGRILIQAGGDAVPVNATIGLLLQDGESLEAAAPAAGPAVSAPVAALPVALPAPSNDLDAETRVFASPLARRVAQQNGVSLAGLRGSGPRGRIVRLDVERAKTGPVEVATRVPVNVPTAVVPAAVPAPAAPAQAVAAPSPAPGQRFTAFPNSGMRKTIARRLSESKRSVPHFYLTVEVELDALLALRQTLNGQPGAEVRLSVNDFIVKAAALALRKVPAANAMWTDDAILRFDDVDVCVAVATDGGLLTPVLRNADAKGLGTIAREIKDLAAKARDGKLKPEEYQGGGFTLSNLGMYGISQFSAIVNPPQSCILAVGAAEKRSVVRDDTVQIRTMMTCTLSVDHRSVDGAVGAQFLAAFKPIIEEPLRLML